MKKQIQYLMENPILAVVAVLILALTILNLLLGEISFFHGMVLHPVFLLVGFAFLLFYLERRSRNNGDL